MSSTPRPDRRRERRRPALPPRYLTPEDLVALLSLPSVETVYQWRRKRIGPPAIRVGKYLRYDPAAVRAWVEHCTDPAAPDDRPRAR